MSPEGVVSGGEPATGRRFTDQVICLDGGSWTDCVFDGCVVTLSATDGLTLSGNRFYSCRFVGDAWPTIFQAGIARVVREAGPPPS